MNLKLKTNLHDSTRVIGRIILPIPRLTHTNVKQKIYNLFIDFLFTEDDECALELTKLLVEQNEHPPLFKSPNGELVVI